ncbi:MAG: hypothetical protein ACYTBS_07800 [Planctomycetota bacterium]|jgi:hypothetical protein
MADTWIGTINTNRPKFVAGYSDMTVRRRLRLSMLKRRGRVMKNQSGQHCEWRLKYSKPRSQGYADGSSVDYENHIAHKVLKLDWRAIVNTDMLTLMQHSVNTGDNMLIRSFQDKANNIMEGLDQDLHGDMFLSGEATGRTAFPHGLETFLGAVGGGVVADRVVAPSATYGLDALSTVIGNYGGAWTSAGTAPSAEIATDWPDGTGDEEYDFNSPLLLNWGSTSWGTSTNTWEANCWRVISQGIGWLMVNSGKDGSPTNVCLAKDLWQGFRNHHEAIRRIGVPHKEAQDLGFSQNVLNIDGVAVHCEFDVPVNTGYIENLNHVDVASTMPDLFWLIHGYDQLGPGMEKFMQAIDMRTLSLLIAGGFFGQFRYKPKYVGKLYPYATA